jgi:hypothetical protein
MALKVVAMSRKTRSGALLEYVLLVGFGLCLFGCEEKAEKRFSFSETPTPLPDPDSQIEFGTVKTSPASGQLFERAD